MRDLVQDMHGFHEVAVLRDIGVRIGNTLDELQYVSVPGLVSRMELFVHLVGVEEEPVVWLMVAVHAAMIAVLIALIMHTHAIVVTHAIVTVHPVVVAIHVTAMIIMTHAMPLVVLVHPVVASVVVLSIVIHFPRGYVALRG